MTVRLGQRQGAVGCWPGAGQAAGICSHVHAGQRGMPAFVTGSSREYREQKEITE